MLKQLKLSEVYEKHNLNRRSVDLQNIASKYTEVKPNTDRRNVTVQSSRS